MLAEHCRRNPQQSPTDQMFRQGTVKLPNVLVQQRSSVRDLLKHPGPVVKRPVARRFTARMVAALVMLSVLSSCSTRQLSDTVPGSTAQRLVTYSLEKFVRDLMQQSEMQSLTGQKIALNVHFLKDHALLGYATQLIRYQLERKFQVEFAHHNEPAQYEVDVFFNSIGTDYDSYGLSIPGFGLTTSPDSRISILSIDMFHGITEGYALFKNMENATTDRTQRILARVRADNVTTPILEFPVNQLD